MCVEACFRFRGLLIDIICKNVSVVKYFWETLSKRS